MKFFIVYSRNRALKKYSSVVLQNPNKQRVCIHTGFYGIEAHTQQAGAVLIGKNKDLGCVLSRQFTIGAQNKLTSSIIT